jgi:hypothetical protein
MRYSTFYCFDRDCRIVFHVPRYRCSLPFVFSSLEAKQHILKITAAGSSGTLFFTVSTMERLFSPCTRLERRNGFLRRFRRHPERRNGFLRRFRRHPELQELNLDVSTEELLSAERAFTYADLYATLGNINTVVWLTPHAAVARQVGSAVNAWEQLDESYHFSFTADGKEINAFAFSPEHLLEICDVVLRLLAVSVIQSVRLFDYNALEYTFINAPTLAFLMEQCQSRNILTLVNLEIDENHCRVLGAYSRPDFEIVLESCTLTNAGASALVEVLGQNQGPTKLALCEIDSFVLADGLRGNSRLKSWRPRLSGDLEVRDREFLAIAGVLRENKGLVDLDLSSRIRVSDETCDAVFDSLKTHPTLEVLDLRASYADTTAAPEVFKSRMQALVDMMKVNMSIRSIHVNSQYSRHELYRESVIPYLETNRLRPRVRAIQKTRPITYRAKVLGLALLAVRTDPNRFWMLLSENAEVVFA